MNKKEIRVTVLRRRPSSLDQGHYQTWSVPWCEGMSVLTALRYINETYDGGLAHYASCRIGICRGCFAQVNGKPVRICTEIVSKDIRVEPLNGYPVVKDLVVDISRKPRLKDEDT